MRALTKAFVARVEKVFGGNQEGTLAQLDAEPATDPDYEGVRRTYRLVGQ